MTYSSRLVSMTLGLAMVVGLTFAGAPASMAATPSESAKKAFIGSIATAAQNSQRQWGIPASVSIAQAIESTDFGTSTLATKARNFFGIRCSAAMTAAGFASLAVAQVGKQYVLGAEALASNPDPKRFDCSELVEWLYARSGNKITDLAAAQYDATKPVSGSPKTGDLVFLRNNPARSNGIGHVAVLTTKLASGDWEIVEARGRAYGVVKSTLSYWKQRSYYAGLRRSASLKFAGSDSVALSSNSSTYQSGCISITSSSGTVTKYRSYSSTSYSFSDHAASIANDSAYKGARALMADIPAFVEALAQVEAPKDAAAYAKTIKNLISTYNLTDYDIVPMSVVLFSGAKGPKVTALQHLLLHSGSSVKVTGTYDAATISAVKSFQSAKALSVDGEAGPATLSALISTVGSGSTGNRVSALHALLNGLGYQTTSGASFGPATVEAVKTFQAAAGLTPDGAATTNTWAKLFMTVDPAPVPSIKGTVALGQTLTAVPGTWGPKGVDLAYQWYRGTTALKGATATTYTVQPADAGTTLKVTVTGTKPGYITATKTSTATATVPLATLTTTPTPKITAAKTSAATAQSAKATSPATPTPKVTGAPSVNQTLTAVPGTWGPGNVELAYQWYRGTTALKGATATTYTVQPADAGTTLKVTVTGTKPGYAPVSKTSTATATIPLVALTATPTPKVTGAPTVNQTLTAVPGTWGPNGVELAYQCYLGTTAIKGATTTTYTVQPADAGTTLKVTVTGTKPGHITATKTSTATATIAKGVLNGATPAISGTRKVGGTLVVTPGSWSPASVTLSYQWYRGSTAISGATTKRYLLKTADKGTTVTVRVRGTLAGFVTLDKKAKVTIG